VRALAACGPAVPQGKLKLYVLVFLIVVIAALSLHPYAAAFLSVYDTCAKCLVVTAAVLTADLVIGSKEVTARRRFDAVGVAALLGGVATALCLPQEYTWAQGRWWQPWLLPSYGMGFLICLIGRLRRGYLFRATLKFEEPPGSCAASRSLRGGSARWAERHSARTSRVRLHHGLGERCDGTAFAGDLGGGCPDRSSTAGAGSPE